MHLTPTERRLLMCLVRNEGRIVSHEELVQAMSPANLNKSIHHLRQYMLRLRKKIEEAPALPRVIITHRGQGYSFARKEKTRWFPEVG